MTAFSPYLRIRRIEFVVTWHCSGRCMHCSVGDLVAHPDRHHCVPLQESVQAIRMLAKNYPVASLMTFGGEPLLYPEVTCQLHAAARDAGIPRRQVITNGFFSRDERRIQQVARMIQESGVNDLLLSVDAFHQARIPIEYPHFFARSLQDIGMQSVRLQPAWLVHASHDNAWNTQTKALLDQFPFLRANAGNDIFMAGNAKKYLHAYYEKPVLDPCAMCGDMPYTEKLTEVSNLSIVPNGDVMVCHFVIGNLLQDSMEDILKRYDPRMHPCMQAVSQGGVQSLWQLAREKGITLPQEDYYSVCDVCKALTQKLDQA